MTPGVIDAADEDGIPDDCHLWQAADTPSPANMHITVTRIDSHTVRAHLFGGVGTPLISHPHRPRGCDINWDFIIDITSVGVIPVWKLVGAHGGFPAYEIYISGSPIYTFSPGPPPYTARDLLKLCGGLDVNLPLTSGELR